MTVERLISLLQKCDPKAQVNFLAYESNCVVSFVEHQLTTNSVLLLDDRPDWKMVGEDDCIEITVLKQEPGFAEITWKDI